jgi:pSer/pThr/pTyr-binding forkhead associated (FHA) protein
MVSTLEESVMSPIISTPKLTIKRQDGSYQELEWEQEVLTIGRDSANDIIIDHTLASRRHARLEHTDSGFFICDLKSTNGTFLNGEPIQDSHILHHQDQVLIADTIITFQDTDATARGPIPVELLRTGQEDIRVDSQTKTIILNGQPLVPPLTVKEFQLLEMLYQRKGQVVSKDEIAQAVWDYEVYDYNAIDALVYRVRQRIEPDPSHPRYLITQRGFGYRLMTTSEKGSDSMP